MNNTSLKINFRSDIPAYAKEKFNDCILIKFFDSEEHRKYFLSGKLYMRSQTDFINSEMGAGRADVTEGAEVVVSHKNDETYPVTKFEMKAGRIQGKSRFYKLSFGQSEEKYFLYVYFMD